VSLFFQGGGGAYSGLRHLWWAMDGGSGTSVPDLVGGVDGTIVGSNITWQSDHILSNNYANDAERITLGTIAVNDFLTLSSGDWSILFRVDLVAYTTFGRVVAKSDGANGANGYDIGQASAGGTHAAWTFSSNPSSASSYLLGEQTISHNYNSSTLDLSMFAFGANVTVDDWVYSSFGPPLNASTPMCLLNFNHSTARRFIGKLYYVAIFDRELTQTETEDLHDTPSLLIS